MEKKKKQNRKERETTCIWTRVDANITFVILLLVTVEIEYNQSFFDFRSLTTVDW